MKLLIFIFFLFILDLYFYLGTVSVFNKLYSNGFIYKIFYWIISLSIYLGIIYIAINYTKKTPSIRFNDNVIYSSLFFILFISKFIGSVPLLIDDILRVFRYMFSFFPFSSHNQDLGRLDFLKKLAIFFSAALASTLLLGMKWGRYNFKKKYKDILIHNWPESLNNYKIIQISDLHLGSFNDVSKIEDVVNIINNEDPDLVVFTGDLVNNYYHEALPYVEALSKIRAKDGKFSVLGNHDYCDYVLLSRDSSEWKDNFNKLLELEKKAGFDLLLNESREIVVDNYKFNLIGVENWGKGNFNKDGDLDKAMSIVDQTIPSILLSHDPSHWREEVLKSNHRIDLQLSGHTHGMQFGIKIPGFKWSPVQYRYKEWAGLYKEKKSQIYVNTGLGHLGYAGRVGIMPEISILNIRREI